MQWTADTNYDLIRVKSTLLMTDGQSGVGVQTLQLPGWTPLVIQHPNGHTTRARIVSASRTSAEIRLCDRTRWHITPFETIDLPLLLTPGHDVQVWVVRKKISQSMSFPDSIQEGHPLAALEHSSATGIYRAR